MPIRRDCLHDARAEADAWQRLLDRARAGNVHAPSTTEVRARLGLASAFSAMNRIDEAIRELQHVFDMNPIEPIGARERAERELRAAMARRASQ